MDMESGEEEEEEEELENSSDQTLRMTLVDDSFADTSEEEEEEDKEEKEEKEEEDLKDDSKKVYEVGRLATRKNPVAEIFLNPISENPTAVEAAQAKGRHSTMENVTLLREFDDSFIAASFHNKKSFKSTLSKYTENK